MRTISNRLEKLEKVFAPALEKASGWGTMAEARDLVLQNAAERGATFVLELTAQLDALGPTGLWLELARIHLRDHGFVQTPEESFAETMQRALGIDCQELNALMQNGRLGHELVSKLI